MSTKMFHVRYIIEDVFIKFHICVIMVASVLKSFSLIEYYYQQKNLNSQGFPSIIKISLNIITQFQVHLLASGVMVYIKHKYTENCTRLSSLKWNALYTYLFIAIIRTGILDILWIVYRCHVYYHQKLQHQ